MAQNEPIIERSLPEKLDLESTKAHYSLPFFSEKRSKKGEVINSEDHVLKCFHRFSRYFPVCLNSGLTLQYMPLLTLNPVAINNFSNPFLLFSI